MSDNKSVKERMIEKYGAECWIDKLQLRPADDPRVYKSKSQMKRMKQLTFHHIREKVKGGKVSEENGAILSVENHIWFNHQPKEVQATLNRIFQEYKAHFNNGDTMMTAIKEYSYDEFIALAKKRHTRARDKARIRRIAKKYLGGVDR